MNLKINFKRYFTLVELIIVIAIIGVLAVSSFSIVTKWISKSRDSRRIAELNQIGRGLRTYYVENSRYPMPDMNYVILTSGSNQLGYQGYVGKNVLSGISLYNDKVKDPLDEKYYTYTTNLQKYQLLSMLKGTGLVQVSYEGQGERGKEYAKNNLYNFYLFPFNFVYSVDYSKRYPYLIGDKLGVIIANTGGNTNAPVQELYNPATFTGLDLTNSNSGYVSYVENNVVYSGTELKITPIYTYSGIDTMSSNSCTPTIYSGYNITALNHNQTQSFTKTGATANGVRTYTLPGTCSEGKNTYGIETTSVTCNSGYVEGTGYTCILDVCGGTIGDVNAASSATSQSAYQSWHRSATAGVCTRSCNVGYSWNGTSCTPNNCIASTQTLNGHSYSVPSFNHGATTTQTSTVSISNGSRTYQQTFSCNLGTVSTQGVETNTANSCNTNYSWNGSSCVGATQTVNCGGSIIANASASTAGTYSQTWNGSAWAPTYSRSYGAGTCGYTCSGGFSWNGSSCVLSNYFAGAGTIGSPWTRYDGVVLSSCQDYNTQATTNNNGTTRGGGGCGNGSQSCLTNGVYTINPSGSPFNTYCLMDTQGGGWSMVLSAKGEPGGTVFQSANAGGTIDLSFSAGYASNGKLSDSVINTLMQQKRILVMTRDMKNGLNEQMGFQFLKTTGWSTNTNQGRFAIQVVGDRNYIIEKTWCGSRYVGPYNPNNKGGDNGSDIMYTYNNLRRDTVGISFQGNSDAGGSDGYSRMGFGNGSDWNICYSNSTSRNALHVFVK